MVQLQVTWYNYNLVHGSATINRLATDICPVELQVARLTHFHSALLQGIPPLYMLKLYSYVLKRYCDFYLF